MNKIKSSDDNGIHHPGSKSLQVTGKHSQTSYSALFPWLIRPHDQYPSPERQHREEHRGPMSCHHKEHLGPRPHYHEEHLGPGTYHHDEHPGPVSHHHGEHSCPGPNHHGVHPCPGPNHHGVHPCPGPHHHDEHSRPHYRYVHSGISLYISDSNREKIMYFKMLMRKDK